MCVPTRHINTTAELAATPPKGYLIMQKAHLIEALYLVNQGTDEAVRGLQRLKKSPRLYYARDLRGHSGET